MRKCKWLGLGLTLLVFAATAHGLITSPLPMEKIMNDSTYAVMAKVSTFEPDKKHMILTVTDFLQGKPAFRQVPIVLEGDLEAKKLKHPADLMKRLGPDLPVVLFITHDRKANKFTGFIYTNGTWIGVKGKGQGKEAGVWDLTHGEPVLRQTFKGTTEEMRKLIADNLAGKASYPEVNKKVLPGFGPEVPQGK